MYSITYFNQANIQTESPLQHPSIRLDTNRAIDIAKIYANAMGEPYTIDEMHTEQRFMVDVHFTGRCTGSEPLEYSWSLDIDPPHLWTAHGAVKTHGAQEPIRAHVLIAHIVQSWMSHGLITEYHDETHYMDDFSEAKLREIYGLDSTPAWLDDYLMRITGVHVPGNPMLFRAAADGNL